MNACMYVEEEAKAQRFESLFHKRAKEVSGAMYVCMYV